MEIFLFYKVLETGIDGKMYWAIKSLYLNNKVCVKINNNNFTEWFDSSNGVRQGDSISPTLFSVFINDLVGNIKSLNRGIKLDDLDISILLYADDVVLISEREEDLQIMLDTLCTWCDKWKVSVNQSKSKIIHFRNVNNARSTYKFRVGDVHLNFSNIYKYLGTYFHEHLSYEDNAHILGESGGRALGSVISKLKRNNFMSYSTFSKLYNSCVTPILDYASEIWGYKNYNRPNLVQNKAMRIFMGVHRYAPVAGLEGDMAWVSPQHRRWLSILRFWNRLIFMSEDRTTKRVFNWAYTKSREGSNNWCNDVKNILSSINQRDYFERKHAIDLGNCRSLFLDKQKSQWLNAVQLKPKLRFYKLFKDCFTVEKYLSMNLSSSERSLLAQIRLGILPLHIETGRFNNIELNERVCNICNSGDIEDECHFLFNCDVYDAEREDWLQTALIRCPDLYYLEFNDQLKFLFCEIPRSTAKFIKKCMTLRKQILYS